MKEKKLDAAWESLVKKYNLNAEQIAQFKLYLDQLIIWNTKFNITTITSSLDVLAYHFDDSLALSQFINLKDLHVIADIGSGGGFPGVPLKILYPHLKLVLIEVNGKKIEFLKQLTQNLNLQDVFFEQIDWRAFIREGRYAVDLFCARASLQVDELLRIFKPGCIYKNSKLVYWAAQNWLASSYVNWILDEHKYVVGDRQRRLILFDSHLIAPAERNHEN
jgi:16S rRNA (guanine(527)-N(7))-methyltransferase RsmG